MACPLTAAIALAFAIASGQTPQRPSPSVAPKPKVSYVFAGAGLALRAAPQTDAQKLEVEYGPEGKLARITYRFRREGGGSTVMIEPDTNETYDFKITRD